VRERLALLGKTLFLVSFGFYLFLLARQREDALRAIVGFYQQQNRPGDAAAYRRLLR
jgi:hypothetical protein